MLVLGRSIVEVLGGADESSKEDSMTGTVHAWGNSNEEKDYERQRDEIL